MRQRFLRASIKWFMLPFVCVGVMQARAQTVPEDVIWTNLVNVTASGNSLQKTGSCDGCLDAGAISQQQLSSGSGYLEFTVSETNLIRYIGLNHNSTGTGITEIPFAIKLGNGYAEARENNQYRSDTPIISGDVLRIEVQSGVVSYAKNGGVFYISGATASYPLWVDTALLSSGSTLSNVQIAVFGGVSSSSSSSSSSGGGTESVVWTNLVNVSASGNSLQKTGGCDGCQDAGALSQQQITSGDGYLEFTVSETGLVRYIGLNHNSTGTVVAEIPFAIRLGNGYAEVRENNQYRSDTPIVSGDVLRIEVLSGVVSYTKNGSVFYFSGATASYPLRVDTALISAGSTLSNALIIVISDGGSSSSSSSSSSSGISSSSSSSSGGAGTESVVWTNLVNVTASGNSLQKTGGCDGCQDAGAVSQQQLSSDGYLEFTVSETGPVRYIGLNHNSTGTGVAEIPFAIRLGNGYAEVRENNQYRSDTPIVSGDVLRIEVLSGVVSYAKNGSVFYTSGATASYPLRVDTALISAGSTLSNAQIAGFSGGSSSSSSSSSSSGAILPPQPALMLTPRQTKIFRFTWTGVSSESECRLLEDVDGLSGYTGIATIPANSIDHELEVFLPGRINARYILQACNSAGCTDSAPMMVSGTLAEAVGYFKASNTAAGDAFGGTVEVSGDGTTFAVGVPLEDSAASGVNGDQNDNSRSNSGAVYVFVRNGAGTWFQQAYLKASDTESRDYFGVSLALSHDGNTLAVGASGKNVTRSTGIARSEGQGAAYVFTRNAGAWSQHAYLTAPTPQVEDGDRPDSFGGAVALSANGNTLAIGIPGQSFTDSGGAYIYTRSGGNWTQQAHITSVNGFAYSSFGASVVLSGDGNTLAVGAARERRAIMGINGTWDTNQPIALASGAAYVFIRNAGVWTEQAYIKASNTEAWAMFAASIALSNDGDTLAVGAPGASSTDDSRTTDGGRVYVFSRSGANWTEQDQIRASVPVRRDYFGKSVALSADSNTLAAGMRPAAEPSGAIYLFKSNAGIWEQRAHLKSPNAGASDAFGDVVVLSGNDNILAAGAYSEESSATGVNGDQNDDSAPGSGAVYLY